MKSAKEFWTLIVTTILISIGWMSGSYKLIDWYMRRRKHGKP